MASEQLYYETRRVLLQSKLEELIGNRNVYFQPPESIKISYPAIIYERHDIQNTHANNKKYLGSCVYKIIILDNDPTSSLVEKISEIFPTIKYNRHYVVSNLNHDVFILYY